MIARVLRLSLQHPWLILAIAAALLVLGGYRLTHMPVDVFPDLTAPRVTVVTESTGLAAEEVERLITHPLEVAVNGGAGVQRVRSLSAPGVSVVWVEFDWQTSGPMARQRVTAVVQSVASSLPPGSSAPTLAPDSSVMGEIAFIALTSDEADPAKLRRVAEIDVRRRLLAVPGVAQVVAIGGRTKQYQVRLRPEKLQRYQLGAHDIVDALQRASANTPGGYRVTGGQELVVRVLGRVYDDRDLSHVIVAMRQHIPVYLRDVADVSTGYAVTRGTGSYQAQPAVVMSITKQPTADTITTTDGIDAVLSALTQDLKTQRITLHRNIFRQQDFIDNAINNVKTVLRDGAFLVVLVLFLFLWRIRPTIISVVAIPLSLAAAVLVLNYLGLTLNTMTLGGLAIAIGELVDDAIVDVENVVRHLRQRAAQVAEARASLFNTVLGASLEIRSSIVSATYIIMLVFVPLLLLDGLEGRLLRPLAISYLVAIFASLVVAVTVTPVLCLIFLPSKATEQNQKEPWLTHWIVARYQHILNWSLRHTTAVAVAALLVVLFSIAGLWGVGRSFLPQFNEGSLTINMVLPPGTPLQESDALATMAERALMADPATISVGRRTGRAERDEHVLGVETSEFEVRLRNDKTRTKSQIFADIRQRLTVVPGAQFEIGQPISHRIEHMISGQRSMFVIKIFGDDLRQNRCVAQQVEAAIKSVPDLVDLAIEPIVDVPQQIVQIDRQAASLYGFSTGAAADEVSLALWGKPVMQVYEDNNPVDVVVLYAETAAVETLTVRSPSGALVPLSAIAQIRRDAGPNYILRENTQRRVLVTANIVGGNVARVYDEVRQRIDAQVKLPHRVRITYAGQFEREAAAGRRLVLFGILSMLGIAMVVYFTLNHLRRTIIVLSNLPLALAGGVIGVHLSGGVLSIATTIGFITLLGIATRNGIILVTRVCDLTADNQPLEPAIRAAATERLPPILMTAITAALGLLPLALALGQPGSEIQAPMAMVILTGLITSTVLNMIVVPALLKRWG